MSFHPGPSSSIADSISDRRPISSLGLGPAPHLELDIPPAHSIGDHGDIIPLGRPVSSVGHNPEQGGWSSRNRERDWGDDSSEEMEGYRVVENERWKEAGRSDEGGDGAGGEEVDPETLRAVEKTGMVVPPKDKPVRPSHRARCVVIESGLCKGPNASAYTSRDGILCGESCAVASSTSD